MYARNGESVAVDILAIVCASQCPALVSSGIRTLAAMENGMYFAIARSFVIQYNERI